MKKFFLMCVCTVLFTGCTVRGPSVEMPSISLDPPISVVGPNSSYNDDDDHEHHHGKGCPPGLAKQGRC